jgi:maltose O-acetyltransferase
MNLLTALKRHIFISLGNTMPMYGPFNRMRASMFRKAGMAIGSDVTIIGPLNLELSLNEETIGGISIGDNVYLNAGTRLACRNSRISIGDDVQVGPRVSFETATHGIVYEPEVGRGLDHQEIHVGSKVWIGAGATILPGVTIHEAAVIAAGAVVTRDVPAYTLVGGVPARKIKDIGPMPHAEGAVV